MVATMLLILFFLPLCARAGEVTVLTFSKYAGKIYAATDPKQFALYGQLTDKILSVNEEGRFYLTPECESSRTKLEDIPEISWHVYDHFRKHFLKEQRGPEQSPKSYTWSDAFEHGQRQFSVIRLDPDTVVYSSRLFPKILARVIISGQVVTFVHFDGTVRMKTLNCLLPNEKILIEGVQKIQPDTKRSFFAPAGDKVLQKHLKQDPIDETLFNQEQSFSKTV